MTNNPPSEPHEEKILADLLQLAHHLGTAEQMAILGEGNVSGQLNTETFLVKASGTQLSTQTASQLVEVKSQPILQAFAGEDMGDEQVESLLLASRVDSQALMPSVETLFHAWLLDLPEIAFVGHTHPICVNQLLCSPRAKEFTERRLFPDQVVYCGAESILIPYVDPGMILARRIAEEVQAFMERTGGTPKTILLENHGIIAIAKTAKQVVATLLMAEKSARVFVGALAAGGPTFMQRSQVNRIAGRSDEHYRQRMIEATGP